MNQNLKLRVMTALVGVPVILGLLLFGGVEGVAFFAWVISMGMFYEYCRMFFSLDDAKLKTGIALAVCTLAHLCNYLLTAGMVASLMGLAPVFCFFLLFLFQVPRLLNYGGKDALNRPEGIAILQKHVQELMALCFGMVYCVWFPMLMVNLRGFASGKHWLIFTLLVVWSGDSFAYFSGKFFGKHLLYETVSPKKTWEGAFGGAFGALIVAGSYAYAFLPHSHLLLAGVMILTICVAEALGDLCESLLKRASNVKDSGSILPGHGGFLDRFDGVVFALPVAYALLSLF